MGHVDKLHERGAAAEACWASDLNHAQVRVLKALAEDGDMAELQERGFTVDGARKLVLLHCTDDTKRAVALATLSANDVPC